MKVTIKEWNTVATWQWDIPEDDVCGICQVHFDGTCPTCKYPGDDCSLCTRNASSQPLQPPERDALTDVVFFFSVWKVRP